MSLEGVSENIKTFWEGFEDPALDDALYDEAALASTAGSLAELVLDTYGISYYGSGGGALVDIDIKSMDCLEAIRASLMEEYAIRALNNAPFTWYKELIVNDTGIPEFKFIGLHDAGISDKILFTLPSFTKQYKKSSVIVTGKKPKQIRRLGGSAATDGDDDTEVWLNLVSAPKEVVAYDEDGDLATDSHPDDLFTNPTLWDLSHLKVPECKQQDAKQYAMITYHDPHLIPAGSTGWKDGITSIYEQESPWQTILGYVYDIDLGPLANFDTAISFEDTATVPYLVKWESEEGVDPYEGPEIGELISRNSDQRLDDDCWANELKGTSFEESCFNGGKGIAISLPDTMRYKDLREQQIDRFLDVTDIYVSGIYCTFCESLPLDEKAASDNDKTRSRIHLFISDTDSVVRKLDKNIQYAVNYYYGKFDDENAPQPAICVTFANNALWGDEGDYGEDTEFFIQTLCPAFYTPQRREGFITEYHDLSDAGDPETTGNEGWLQGKGTLLPLGGGQGIIVQQIWADIKLVGKSISIYQPNRGDANKDDENKPDAIKIAKALKIQLAAITLEDEPPPIAIDGELIDQLQGVRDNDPTTSQPLSDSDFQKKMLAMDDGGGISITMSSLSAEYVRDLSLQLKHDIDTDDGSLYTYTLAPDAVVELGNLGPRQQVINEINYSYSDSGSYTISVTEGPKFLGNLASITGGPYFKQSENLQSQRGIVIQSRGNNRTFKVRVDGIGEVEAANGTCEVIRPGDRVSLTIHNNPVES